MLGGREIADWPILMATIFAYVNLAQVIKVWLLRMKWI